MYLSRIVVRNYRNFKKIDIPLNEGVTCVIGENNTGKTNLLHALRLAIDANLPGIARQLEPTDFHHSINPSAPTQVLVAVEFRDFLKDESAAALLGTWQVAPDLARVTYRFRPRPAVREEIADGIRPPAGLRMDDYHWELTGGGDKDPATVEWNEDVASVFVRFQDLSDLNVTYLPPLRDVQQALRRAATSPLRHLVDILELPDDEKRALVEAIADANKDIEDQEQLRTLGTNISDRFKDTSGPAFAMGVKIGVSPATFEDIARSLSVLLSDDTLKSFDVARNGLGLNNILYISLLLEHFQRRGTADQVAGNILLFEEPEAHVHPELQNSVYAALKRSTTQTILTTHSTHICSTAPLESYLVLTREQGVTNACLPGKAEGLTENERTDIERYLDATRSRLLFARRILLVEGAAEQFLVPALAKDVMNIDLDRHGIAVVAIQGTHFHQYTKLFSANALHRRCAVLGDGDKEPDETRNEEQPLAPTDNPKASLESDWVRTFICRTTFERALTTSSTLPMLVHTLEDLNASKTLKQVRTLQETLNAEEADTTEQQTTLFRLRELVLQQAKTTGKGRFAQIAARHAALATAVPTYVEQAIRYLVDE